MSPSAPLVDFPVRDAMPAFFAFVEQARGGSVEKAVRCFRAVVVAAHPNLYAPAVLGVKDLGAAFDARLADWIPRALVLEPTMRRLHATFRPTVDAAVSRFLTALPGFRPQGGCHLFASIDTLNGGVRAVDGTPSLLFGLDVIAADRTGSMPLPVLFAHELFHVHHAQALATLPERPPRLFVSLWGEGLATHASIVLTAGTTDLQALPMSHLHDPASPRFDHPARRVSLAEVMPSHARALGAALRACFDSSQQADYATFFLGRASDQLGERPVRSGYWFGLEIARRLAHGRSLAELARLDPHAEREAIMAALDAIIAAA